MDGSRDWRAFEDHLLPKNEARPVGIGGETDPARYIAARAAVLHDQLTFVAGCAKRGELDGVEIEEGRLEAVKWSQPSRGCSSMKWPFAVQAAANTLG